MKILHYSLGFPPYRTGGLTKFCMDLMREQVKEGHEVALLWPGEMRIIAKGINIRKHHTVDGIGSYEVINPLPVPFDEGIKDFKVFMDPGERSAFENLLADLKPDVIHIHTLMGLHKSFLNVAKDKGIRLVFSAHDFFPVCPKVTLFRNGQICDCIESSEQCGTCNNTALSLKKIQILQSPLYRMLKDSALVKRLRKQHRDEYLENTKQINTVSVGTVGDYKSLRQNNLLMLRMMDIIHFNSSVTKQVYERVYEMHNDVVIPITHSGIADHRKIRSYNDSLKIRYMGPRAKGKGFSILNEAVKKLWIEGRKITLDVHFTVENKPDYMNCHGRFTTAELEEIFNQSDILVCPSIWYETFGYTVLEALSYGVPVIVSDTVGAKDIIVDGAGVVINRINTENLYEVLRDLYSDDLEGMNRIIVDNQSIMTIGEMAHEIENKVYAL